MEISKKLQEQVRLLCKEIPHKEWSGVLFYTTEGQFGEPGFKCTAQEVFLMDIGSSTGTEYTFGPEVVKHMMENPELKTMLRGHIHSHINFDVYFSGTDKNEIYNNSEFHNFYLSLIVNNANDMVAKICFRVNMTHSTAEFMDQAGKKQVVEVKDPQEMIWIYDCDITKPELRENPVLNERIQQLKGGAAKKSFRKETDGNAETKSTSPTGDLRQFVRCLLDRDLYSTTGLVQILKDGTRMLNLKSKKEIADYFTQIQTFSQEAYKHVYKDKKFVRFRETIKDAIAFISQHEEEYPDFVSEVKDHLNVLARFKYDESETRTNTEYYGGYH